MSSSNKVRNLRLARAWSQEQLAEMASLSVRTVQRIENGEQPSLETLSALAAVFDTSVAELTDNGIPAEQSLDQIIADARQRIEAEKRFYRAAVTAVVVCTLLWFLNQATSADNYWSAWVALIWGALLLVKGFRLFVLRGVIERWQNHRLQRLVRK
ncbi:helix-turn-helix domain-containing protein [Erwiniaceae bacterium BAC15a-03b]|uniref:Helix-turn-helix domain-containing protein n=1 Tax=Winslowiella arboricola TaxID=2978220 RepID=A0A9J6PY32_9GAMM|nr:helix-turn-helix domain-containing protein [Winslowiella arboricola]MCU5772434.1 helix-turn-helix domain-containing protein [Winslowiella arboricola]MCU5779772.1 helix-turn-helix domain-containing protein [Winslowiella arboricola]